MEVGENVQEGMTPGRIPFADPGYCPTLGREAIPVCAKAWWLDSCKEFRCCYKL